MGNREESLTDICFDEEQSHWQTNVWSNIKYSFEAELYLFLVKCFGEGQAGQYFALHSSLFI